MPAASASSPVRLPATTTSYAAYARALTRYARSAAGASALAAEARRYWLVEHSPLPLAAASGVPLDWLAKEPMDTSTSASSLAETPPAAAEEMAAWGWEQRNTEGSARTVWVTLEREETTALLRGLPCTGTTQARIQETLLAALALTWRAWTGSAQMPVALEGHGRDVTALLDGEAAEIGVPTAQTGTLGMDAASEAARVSRELEQVDLSRTVGWCTGLAPLRLMLPADELTQASLGQLLDAESQTSEAPAATNAVLGATLEAALRAVTEQVRALPHAGLSYGLLRWLHPDPHLRAQLAGAAPTASAHASLSPAFPALSFNYLGQFGAGQFDVVTPAGPSSNSSDRETQAALLHLQPVQEPLGSSRHPESLRPFVLDLVAEVSGGQLRVGWTYSTQLHRAETISRLAARYLAALRLLIAYSATPHANAYTSSDFPLAGLNQKQMSKLATMLKTEEERHA